MGAPIGAFAVRLILFSSVRAAPMHDLRTYQSDGLLHYHVMPPVAVLPGSAEEVRDVVRACHAVHVPWVARGSGSGLSGGALPIADGVLLVLSRMRRILEVDLDNQRVVVTARRAA